ncbi:MAG: septal ring lytic transglycosylase RlpA family protein [Solirubrobacterales bacterium]
MVQRLPRIKRRWAAFGLVVPVLVASAATPVGAPAAETTARLSVNDRSAAYNQQLRFQGTLEGKPNAAVQLRFKRAGRTAWASASSSRTDSSGRFTLRARARTNGTWQVRGADAASTTPVTVRVRSRATTRVRSSVGVGSRAVAKGSVRPGTSGRRVYVQARRPGSSWKTVARVRTRKGGAFTARWRVRSASRFQVRALARADRHAGADRTAARSMNVWRSANASWYGPGLYGNGLACGGRLHGGTIGVAHKTLPCGTKLTLKRGSRTVNVRVIDRGPFHPHREFDLTGATKRALGFGSTGSIQVTRR